MNFYQLLYDLQRQVVWQNQKLLEVESLLKRLEERLAAMELQPQTRIDKIEYRFDQLKVEKLEGALHIGISPGTKGILDELSVNGKETADFGWGVSPGEGTGEPAKEIPVEPDQEEGAVPTGTDGTTPAETESGEKQEEEAGSAGSERTDGMTIISAHTETASLQTLERFLGTELPGIIEGYEEDWGLPLGPDYRRFMIEDLRRQVGERLRLYLLREGVDSPAVADRAAEKVKRDVIEAVRRHLARIKGDTTEEGFNDGTSEPAGRE